MPFGSLWLPVVVAAVAVWFLSAILHMVLRYHKADVKQLAGEDKVAQALRESSPSPGVYFIPYCADPGQLKDPAVRKKFVDGPVVALTVRPSGEPGLGASLATWFLFCFLVSFVTGYLARHSLTPGASGLEVMRITGAVAFVGYGFGAFQDSIWKSIPWANSLRALIDALFYALATALVFRLLWPAA